MDTPQKHSEIISWRAPEFDHSPKDVSWYWVSIVCAVLILLFALWQKDVLFAIFVILAELMLLRLAKEKPKDMEFELSAKGLAVGTLAFYNFEELTGFHIHEREQEPYSELVLKTRKRLHPYLHILIRPKDITVLRNFLGTHLQEIEYQTSLAEGISRMIGF